MNILQHPRSMLTCSQPWLLSSWILFGKPAHGPSEPPSFNILWATSLPAWTKHRSLKRSTVSCPKTGNWNREVQRIWTMNFLSKGVIFRFHSWFSREQIIPFFFKGKEVQNPWIWSTSWPMAAVCQLIGSQPYGTSFAAKWQTTTMAKWTQLLSLYLI